jgi:8-oxo-dGTP diphosphatase
LADYRNPAPTVDIIIELGDRPHRPIVLVERKFEPLGWAIPGGFVDYGESVEDAARREALEETGLEVQLIQLLQVYSDPKRDRRKHTISLVYVAEAIGLPVAADDAKALEIFELWNIPTHLCFDHDQIVMDYRRLRNHGILPSLG